MASRFIWLDTRQKTMRERVSGSIPVTQRTETLPPVSSQPALRNETELSPIARDKRQPRAKAVCILRPYVRVFAKFLIPFSTRCVGAKMLLLWEIAEGRVVSGCPVLSGFVRLWLLLPDSDWSPFWRETRLGVGLPGEGFGWGLVVDSVIKDRGGAGNCGVGWKPGRSLPAD
jgi:hypothetical protein